MFTYLFNVSRRWEMALLLISGITIVYTLRVNMSVAAPKMRDDLHWSEDEKGYVLSSFYWGYAAGQIPAVLYAKKYGARGLFGLSVLITSILTILMPLAANTSLGWALFLRMMIGFFESASFPAVFYFLPFWVPKDEKTIMIPCILSGVYIGEIIGFSASGYLVESIIVMNGVNYGAWESVFYVFGLAGVAWYPLWYLCAYDKPESHPFITQEELQHILKGTDIQASEGGYKYQSIPDTLLDASLKTNERSSSSDAGSDYQENPVVDINRYSRLSGDKLPYHRMSSNEDSTSSTPLLQSTQSSSSFRDIPWYHIFTNKASLTNFACSWVFGFIGFMLLSEMPSFLTDQLHFDLSSAGMLCIAPYAGMFIATIGFGALFDRLQARHGWSARSVRQSAQFVAFGGAGGLLLICGFVDDKYVAYIFMVLGQALLGVSQVGLACVYLEIAPRYSSIMNTIGNTIGAIAGIAGPIVVALCIDSWEGIWGWRVVFMLSALMCVVSLTLWAKYQTSDIIPELNNPASRSRSENKIVLTV